MNKFIPETGAECQLYPRRLKMRVGGKRVKALNIDKLCD